MEFKDTCGFFSGKFSLFVISIISDTVCVEKEIPFEIINDIVKTMLKPFFVIGHAYTRCGQEALCFQRRVKMRIINT